jgi:hypothetical protein
MSLLEEINEHLGPVNLLSLSEISIFKFSLNKENKQYVFVYVRDFVVV